MQYKVIYEDIGLLESLWSLLRRLLEAEINRFDCDVTYTHSKHLHIRINFQRDREKIMRNEKEEVILMASKLISYNAAIRKLRRKK